MPNIEITSHLAQHAECPPTHSVDASTLGSALEQVFSHYPQLRQQVLDPSGTLHQHIALFVDGEMVQDRDQLVIPISDNSEIFVMQALSGG